MSGALESRFNGLAAAQPALPAAWYRDPAHHARELDAIWRRSWLYLCRAETLAGPRAFRSFSVAGQEILLVRGEDGALRGYFNTCRHRGSMLCTATAGRLERGLIVCPYHQWAYDLEGRLRATGAMRKVAGFDRAEHGLHPVAVAEWGGFVFVNPAGAAAVPFLEQFGAELAWVVRWPLADLVVGHSYRRTLACNWKVFWENFNECLHCPNVHPELCELVPIYGRAIMARRDDPDWQAQAANPAPAFAGGLRAGAETWSTDGRAQGVLAGLSAEDRAAGQRYATLVPSVFIAAHVDYVRAVRILPLGPEAMELSAEWLFDPAMLARADFDMARITEFGTLVMEQDGAACELNQRGLRSAAFERGVLMQEEYEVFLFQDWVRGQLGEPTLGEPTPGEPTLGEPVGSRASRRAE
ncbi:MAG TPA: aromatic ring-hydroxylating dioxygenase subunit alpha [Thermohalobaculum sp.]|nr:aromatic ring-hydroxylating dioxygenase subunit alpha [Thermohalobaculum sp.]